MNIVKENFGITPEGKQASLYTLQNSNGMTAKITDYGANLVSLLVPDEEGRFEDVVLGYGQLEGYFVNPAWLGSTVGRNSNRIKDAEVTIDGITFQLEKNDGENNLHGSSDGYNKKLWDASIFDGEEPSLKLSYRSPDGEQGFPGNLKVEITFTLTNSNELKITYSGVSDKDTVFNMTNHSYFNLSGHKSGDVCAHELWLASEAFTPVVNSASIPTGEIASVYETPMDFTKRKPIGRDIEADYEQLVFGDGYDHNWVLNNNGKVEKVAMLWDPASGRTMEVFTDCPGIQVYTGNFLNEKEFVKEGAIYGKRHAVCLETQYFPDAMHHENFQSPIIKAGEKAVSTTIYKFGTEER